jgi:hypothetical protein
VNLSRRRGNSRVFRTFGEGILVCDLVLEGNDWIEIEAGFSSLSSLMALLLRSAGHNSSAVSFLILVLGAVPLDRPLSVKHRGALNPRVSAMIVRLTPG